jgi:hypothetical protein
MNNGFDCRRAKFREPGHGKQPCAPSHELTSCSYVVALARVLHTGESGNKLVPGTSVVLPRMTKVPDALT